LHVGKSTGTSIGVNYLQAVTPTLTLGGHASYSLEKENLKTEYAGVYDDGEQLIQGLLNQEHDVIF
jgi:hypothetical protein